MSQQPGASVDPSSAGGPPPIERVFDVADAPPYEIQRVVQRYLSQETRHNVLQVILGHPAHLVSITEFDYYIPRSRSTIAEQLDDLAAHDIIQAYHHEPNENKRDLPADFWGLTEFGMAVLAEYNYLRGLPIMRAVHDATHKTETVERHEAAPRPSLPEAVTAALDYEETTPDNEVSARTSIRDLREQTFYAAAAPADSAPLNDEEDGRTLDELFEG